jgi:hypothetical protein
MTLKPVVYRGGIVSFGIPLAWREEFASDGGGMFYEDKPDSGTLRLNVLSFEKKEPMPLEAATKEIFGGGYEILPAGFPIRRYVKKEEERATPLHLHRWEVLVPVLPNRWRLVCFTHTILAAHEESSGSINELQLVDAIVRQANYSTEPGALPKRPWWRFW